MPPAAAREKEGSELGTLGGGAPQTPAGGLRPPAPPAERYLESLFKKEKAEQTQK